MAPKYLPRSDVSRQMTDLFKRVERLERRLGVATTTNPSATGAAHSANSGIIQDVEGAGLDVPVEEDNVTFVVPGVGNQLIICTWDIQISSFAFVTTHVAGFNISANSLNAADTSLFVADGSSTLSDSGTFTLVVPAGSLVIAICGTASSAVGNTDRYTGHITLASIPAA